MRNGQFVKVINPVRAVCIIIIKQMLQWLQYVIKFCWIILYMMFIHHSKDKSAESVEYDFETVHNIHIWGCELASTTKEGMRSWNMSVQYWLAAYVYRRVPRSYGYGR